MPSNARFWNPGVAASQAKSRLDTLMQPRACGSLKTLDRLPEEEAVGAAVIILEAGGAAAGLAKHAVGVAAAQQGSMAGVSGRLVQIEQSTRRRTQLSARRRFGWRRIRRRGC